MSLEITGKVVKILDTQRFVSKSNGNEWIKNTFVVETSGDYPKQIAFSVLGEDKFAQMGIKVGMECSVSFEVSSREWNGKYFTEANAWRVVAIGGGANNDAPQQAPTATPAPQPSNGGGDDNDLPF